MCTLRRGYHGAPHSLSLAIPLLGGLPAALCFPRDCLPYPFLTLTSRSLSFSARRTRSGNKTPSTLTLMSGGHKGDGYVVPVDARKAGAAPRTAAGPILAARSKSGFLYGLCTCCTDCDSCLEAWFCTRCQMSRQCNMMKHGQPEIDWCTCLATCAVDYLCTAGLLAFIFYCQTRRMARERYNVGRWRLLRRLPGHVAVHPMRRTASAAGDGGGVATSLARAATRFRTCRPPRTWSERFSKRFIVLVAFFFFLWLSARLLSWWRSCFSVTCLRQRWC